MTEVNRDESQFALSVNAESFVPKVDKTQIVATACFKNKCFLSTALILVKDKYLEWGRHLGPLTGNLDSINGTKVHCGLIRDEDLNKTLEKFWKVEEVAEPIVKNKERLICEEHYVNIHFRTKEGKYVVSMPLKRNPRVWVIRKT
ncbi:uncharacterized protein TNCV_3231171 [Trichonephila clavipes]|nr:uncharacterized protein TNCV_3231171 [Trichonephila clavipes]